MFFNYSKRRTFCDFKIFLIVCSVTFLFLNIFLMKLSVRSELLLKRTNPESFVRGGFTGVSNQYSYDRNIMPHFFGENISFTSRLVWYPREPLPDTNDPGFERFRTRSYHTEIFMKKYSKTKKLE